MSKKRRGTLSELLFLMWKDKFARPALIYIAFFLALGILSFFWPGDYAAQNLAEARQGPSAEHWFGTDMLGRDMFTRVLYAARVTDVLIVMTAFLGGMPLAIILGVVAGYFGGKAEAIIMRVGEIFIGVPALLFILLFTAIARPRYDDFIFNLGPVGEWIIKTGVADLALIFLVTSMIFWVGPARMYRSQVLSLRDSAFVESAKMLGASNKRIIFRHILPQLYTYIAHSALLMFAGVIGTEIALSFFGIGIRPPHPSFGAMFSETASSRILNAMPHLVIIPGLIVGLFLFAILFLELRLTRILASEHEREGE
ncbi:MAG: ABC transporter permease [Candidatus Spechtbacterales bacterium]